MRHALSVVVAITLASGAAWAAETRPQLFVLDTRGDRGVDPGLLRLLDDVILDAYAKTGQYVVVGKDEISALLDQKMREQLAGADCAASDECLVAIGGAIGAPFLAITNVGRVGEHYSVTLKVLEMAKARAALRWNAQVPPTEEALLAAVRRGVAELHPSLLLGTTVVASLGGLSAVLGVVGAMSAMGGYERMQTARGPEWNTALAQTQGGANLATVAFSIAGTAVVTAVVLGILGI